MPLDLRCERCNGHIVTVSYSKIRDYVQENGEVCKSCLDMEVKLKSFFEKKKQSYIRRLDSVEKQALDDLKHEIARLSGGADNNEGRQQLQGNGNHSGITEDNG